MRRRVRTIAGLAVLTLLLGLGGSSAHAAQDPPSPGQGPAAAGPSNAYCPVLPDEDVDPEIFTEHDGQRVYFCCRKCLRKFERDPDAYLATLASLTAPMPLQQPGAEEDEHGSEEHAGHEHEHEHEALHATGLARFVAWLGNFHSPMVNFPIGLLTAAAVAELLLALTRRPAFADVVRFCVWFGGIGALAAALLGWFFGGFHLVDDDWILTTHRWVGTSTALWAAMLLWLNARTGRPGPEQGRRAFRAALLIGAGLVSAAGFLGGAMVYGIDHYAW